ncbi:MAG: transposase family protein [Symploca sp. SIO3C6]|uniref:Transposase family protein n=1 Tax=Symploca sp. SIO1C4 TaxID=2607765 RepID=A0A6B3N801_9CYAN|nr:transposase family protein [Symploca sp. SIO3C6]NER26224.1 transposase family protein [Symploca sp. SIO1C4]NET03433.1 transposase family protein [Symploca sp. SIO2B6]NET48887.1 transposase family protein [Merismopedia sp. SIO2A8]
MTKLLNCLHLAQNFCISVSDIAQFLNISEHQIMRIESWKYVL